MKESKRITKRVGKPYPDGFRGSKVEMEVTINGGKEGAMTRDEALTHDEIYKRLYAAWLQLPGCDGKTSIGGLIADLESEPEPSPCACGGEKPRARGYVLNTDDWCDGELGFRHIPVYLFAAGVAELAKEMGCGCQPVLIFDEPEEAPCS